LQIEEFRDSGLFRFVIPPSLNSLIIKRKEIRFWQLIYRPSKGQGKMKKGGFGTSKSNRRWNLRWKKCEWPL